MNNPAKNSAAEPWVPSETEFGTRLAMVRQHQGWNLTEASVKCGLGPNDWARYEQGVAPRKLLDVVTKISNATLVEPNWLLWGPQSPTPTPESDTTDTRRYQGGEVIEGPWSKPVSIAV